MGRNVPGTSLVYGKWLTGGVRNMFERFTDEARLLMAIANQEALVLGHDFVGPEHILFAMFSDQAAAQCDTVYRLNEALGLDRKTSRAELGYVLGERMAPSEAVERPSKLPVTLLVKRVINRAMAESRLHIGTTYVGPEHIFLGIISEDSAVTGEFLEGHQITLQRARVLIHSSFPKRV